MAEEKRDPQRGRPHSEFQGQPNVLGVVLADLRKAKGWTLARMPLIDLTVMRIAGFELLGRLDVPVAVVLDEAVELAKRFSTDDSGRFVNGVLSALVPVLRPAVQPDGRTRG